MFKFIIMFFFLVFVVIIKIKYDSLIVFNIEINQYINNNNYNNYYYYYYIEVFINYSMNFGF